MVPVCALLFAAFGWGLAFACPMDQELAEGMYWTYQVEVRTYYSPGMVFNYNFTLTIRAVEKLEASSLPASFESLLPFIQGWSLKVTLDLPWEQREETLPFWRVSPVIPIVQWPLPVLFVVDQDFLRPFLLAPATVGIVRGPDGAAVLVRELQGPKGEIIPVRVELIVVQNDDASVAVEEFGEVCGVDYKAEAWSREHRGSAWWSKAVPGWVYAEGEEVSELRAPLLRYRIKLKDWWRR